MDSCFKYIDSSKPMSNVDGSVLLKLVDSYYSIDYFFLDIFDSLYMFFDKNSNGIFYRMHNGKLEVLDEIKFDGILTDFC